MKISVIIPCHNEGELLYECVNSVLCQNFLNVEYEILLISDFSNDKTIKVLDYFSKNKKIQIIYNDRQLGASRSRNRGIKIATGDWIIFLDADDVLTDFSIQFRLESLYKFDKASFFFGDFQKISYDGCCIEDSWYMNQISKENIYKYLYEYKIGNELKDPLQYAFFIYPWTGTIMVKKSEVINAGCFDEKMVQGEDILLWLKIMSCNRVVFIPKILAKYRQRECSLTYNKVDFYIYACKLYEKLLLMEEFGRFYDIIHKKLINNKISLMWCYRNNKQFIHALNINFQLICVSPLQLEYWKNMLGILYGLCQKKQ